MSIKAKFATHCKLTCLGGSEKGTCECHGPATCELRSDPGFQHARNEAVARMGRYIESILQGRVKA